MPDNAHPMSANLHVAALNRFNDIAGDAYRHAATDGDFRVALLRANDAQIIMIGTLIELYKGSNGHRRRRDRVRAAVLPVLGGTGGIGLLIYIRDILDAVLGL